MMGWGTKTCRRPGMPLWAATCRTTVSNLSVCMATVGTPYVASTVIAGAATAGAQVLQWPTPRMAASPRDLISFQVVGSSLRYTLEIGLNTVRTPGMRSANHPCICLRKMSESSKRQSTRYTVLPSRVSSRGARGLRVTLGAKPSGFNVVILPFVVIVALPCSGCDAPRTIPLPALGRVRATAHRHQRLLLVVDVHVDEGDRAPHAPHPRGARDHAAHRGPEIVDAQVDGGHTPANRHAHREIAHDVDEGGEGAAVELRGARPPLELWTHGHGHGQGARVAVEGDGAELQETDEGRGIEGGLDLLDGERGRRGLAHGRTTTLPNTSRSSRRRKASFTSSSGSSRSMTGVSCPARIMAMRVSRSSRIQPFEPRIFSSKVQMKRRSSLGSKPAVAPQVRIRPCRCSVRSEGTQVSPPVKLTTTSR